jgi:hypothetical protein
MTSAVSPGQSSPTMQVLSQLGLLDEQTLQLAQALSAPAEPAEDLAQKIAALEAENARLRETTRSLLAHSDFLAAAVGACPECWGENPDCAECGGEGGPGCYLPERVCFDEIVRPVIKSLRAHIGRRRQQRKVMAAEAAAAEPADRPTQKEK